MNELKDEHKRETLASRVNAWIGIISILSTVILSVFTFYINTQRQEAQDKVQITQNMLDNARKEFQQKLEEKRFQKEKYELVSTILRDLSKDDAENKNIKINLIRLFLDDAESERLFLGLQFSKDAVSQEIGKIGTNDIREQKTKYSQAVYLENKAFEFLINGKDEDAIQAFKQTESIYPQFRSALEISILLERNKSDLTIESKRKSIFQKIINEYQVPENYSEKLRELSR